MSPEQALARHGLVDHRADIYALGATLYELLTLRPAVEDGDCEEILRRVVAEEPRPPRQHDRAIPRDLETITLKALAKEPERRYATAQELADDLGNFLEDRPIRARRPAWSTQVRRWCRRHKPLVAAGVTLLVAAVLGSGVTLWHRQQQRAETEHVVVGYMKQAGELREKGRYADAHQVLDWAEERLQQGGPAYLGESLRALRDDVSWVHELDDAQMQLSQGFDFAGADRAYTAAFAKRGLDLAVLSPEEAARRIHSSPIRARLVLALDHWQFAKKNVKASSEESSRAVARLLDADRWREQLRDPTVRRDQAALIRLANEDGLWKQAPETLYLLSLALRTSGAGAKAEEVLRQAQQRYPADFWINFGLAGILDASDAEQALRLEEALGFYRVALALRPGSAMTHNNLGIALDKRGKFVEAVAAFQKATQLNPGAGPPFANLGLALTKLGKLGEAEAACRKAIALKPDQVDGYINLARILQRKGKPTEADAVLRSASEAVPDKRWWVLFHVGIVLMDQGELARSEAAYRKVIDLKPEYAEVYTNLGLVLQQQRKLEDAVAAHRKAIELRNNYPNAYTNLGLALQDQGKLAEAEAAYRKAIALQPAHVKAHMNLGIVLERQRRLPEAVAALSHAVVLDPNYASAHNNLGLVLRQQGKLAEAEAAYRKAIALNPNYSKAHNNLGMVLCLQGKLAEGEAAYRKAVAVQHDNGTAHFNLGTVLAQQGKMSEAESPFRKAIALQPENAEAFCNLGLVLKHQGRFADALAALQRGDQLGSRTANWRYPSAQWVREVERLVVIADRLPKLLSGEAQPADAVERLAVAGICGGGKKLYAAAVRFYREAFAAQPKLAADLRAGHRYDAACAAAQAGCGLGQDAGPLDDKERARLRRQALDWLRADLTQWDQLLQKVPDKVRSLVLQKMQHWQQDPDFTGVRGPEALSRLPAAERPAWQQLWEDVEALRKSAAGTP
jgi:superkiller protein 3